MSEHDDLPVSAEEPPPVGSKFDDVDTHLLEITRHDTRDIVIGRDYFIMFIEDANCGRYVVSNVSASLVTDDRV